MTIEERKSNIYFDKKGRQILVGDLLKIYHFKTKRKIHYMYHHIVMEDTKDFPVMAIQSYISNKPHCRLFVLCDNQQRVFENAEIVYEYDYQTKRQRIKIKL